MLPVSHYMEPLMSLMAGSRRGSCVPPGHTVYGALAGRCRAELSPGRQARGVLESTANACASGESGLGVHGLEAPSRGSLG